MPINMYLVKRGGSVTYEREVSSPAGAVSREVPGGEPDEFCGFPHIQGVVPKSFDWGEYYGD